MTLNKCKQRQTCGLFVWTYLKKKLEFAREFTLCPITNIRPLLPVLCFDFSHRPLLGY